MTKIKMNSLGPLFFMCILVSIGLTPVPGQADCGQPVETALIAGQHIPVGTVTIENDENNLYVTYQTDGDWLITETHLDVATRPEDLKQTSKGNAVPGRFAYKSEHDPGVATVTHTIDLTAWPSGAELYLAAHCVVVSASGSETAWGEGMDFPGSNWAMYISYLPQSCAPPPVEPGVIDLMPSNIEVQEDGVMFTLQLIRTNGSDGQASVTLTSSDITATAGDDYETVNQVVTFADGETEKSVEVYVLDDYQIEPDEQFRVQISDVTGAEAGTNTETLCTIIDNDHVLPQ
jgi:Calx-beta domain